MENKFDKGTALSRRETIEVRVGNMGIGGRNPVRIQSMTNTSALDTRQTVNQILRLEEAGCELVRIAVPTEAEAENLKKIKKELQKQSSFMPLIADVHFNPKTAETAARIVEKVRINPGNYVDKKHFRQLEYTEAEYGAEIERIAQRLAPLLAICRQYGTAIRIGTNHGSLSDRIVSRYGNTALAMAVSAMEYAVICRQFGFDQLVLSMKSSNVKTMITSVKLLVGMMQEKDMYFPLHLGVTEAGNREYGRIKSAAGIGSLLRKGLGDTLRVSLTEKPENEIPLAILLRELALPFSDGFPEISSPHPFLYSSDWRSKSVSVEKIDAKHPSVVFVEKNNNTNLHEHPSDILVIRHVFHEQDENKWIAHAASDIAALLFEYPADGIVIENQYFSIEDACKLSLNILQACGFRYSQAEFVSCPTCGRTLYDVEQCFEDVKSVFGHLKGLKIGVMGCIVNGPGEMADADYGIVGSGKNQVTLYKKQNPIIRNIPQQNAVNRLLQLIKDNNQWKEKPR